MRQLHRVILGLILTTCLFSLAVSTYAQIPPHNTLTTTSGNLTGQQLYTYSAQSPVATVRVGAGPHEYGDTAPDYVQHWVEISAPNSSAQTYNVSTCERRCKSRPL